MQLFLARWYHAWEGVGAVEDPARSAGHVYTAAQRHTQGCMHAGQGTAYEDHCSNGVRIRIDVFGSCTHARLYARKALEAHAGRAAAKRGPGPP